MASTIILSDNGVSSGSAGLKETGGNDGVLILQTTTSGGTATNAVYVDNLQNVGVGATPSTWGIKALQVETSSMANSGTGLYESTNAYFNAGAWKYIGTGTATQYYANASGGEHVLRSTTSGSANGTITWTNVAVVNKDTTFALQGGSSTSGTGIAFPATQSASTNANTLDDYEEGTFTPYYTSVGGTPTVSYGQQSGIYTKIGNLVTVTVRVTTSSVATGGSGAIAIAGLPFASSSLPSNTLYSAAVSFIYAWVLNPQIGFVSSNDTTIQLYSSSSTNTTSKVADIGGTCYLSMTVSYQAA